MPPGTAVVPAGPQQRRHGPEVAAAHNSPVRGVRDAEWRRDGVGARRSVCGRVHGMCVWA